jgi:hypothetical protein
MEPHDNGTGMLLFLRHSRWICRRTGESAARREQRDSGCADDFDQRHRPTVRSAG